MATQSDYYYTLEVSGDTAFDVVSFKLTEALSMPFVLELALSSFDPHAAFSKLIDTSATLTF